MTAIVADFDTFASTPSARVESLLHLPAAAGMGRAFLLVHCAPPRQESSRDRAVRSLAGALSCDEEVQAFVSELRELGGMAVIA